MKQTPFDEDKGLSKSHTAPKKELFFIISYKLKILMSFFSFRLTLQFPMEPHSLDGPWKWQRKKSIWT